MMLPIYFTKFLKGMSPAEIGETAGRLGVRGLDLAIRAGQAVSPANVREALPAAMETWRSQGLAVPLATLETSATDPHQPEVRAILQACGENGIGCVKLGYWSFRPGDHYWDRVSEIRRALEEFSILGEQYGVCALVHTHSGGCYGSNASGAMHLVEGLDPRTIGVYLDPGHLALNGEPLEMAVAMAGPYLKAVAVKNPRHLPAPEDSSQRWVTDWCSLEEGLVDWPHAIHVLKSTGFDGILSLHGEYSMPDDTPAILARVAVDARYLVKILS